MNELETDHQLSPHKVQLEDRWNWLQSKAKNARLQEETTPSCHIPSARKKWRKLETPLEGRCSHTLTAMTDEYLILVGGGRSREISVEEQVAVTDPSERHVEFVRMMATFEHFDDCWMLNAVTATWTKLEANVRPPKPHEDAESYWGMSFGPPRRQHMAAAYTSNYLIVFGGISKDGTLDDLWVLHVPSLQWKQMRVEGEEKPQSKFGGVCFVHKDHFYVMTCATSQELWKLGPLSCKSWTWSIQRALTRAFLHKRAPQWPTVSLGVRPLYPLQYSRGTVIGTKLWIFGGVEVHGEERVVTNLLYRLDLESWEWTVLYAPKNAPCARSFHGMTSIGKFLLIMGGQTIELEHEVADVAEDLQGCRSIFDVFYFDTEAMSWKQDLPTSVEGDWPCARNGLCVERLGHHCVVMGGGIFSKAYYADTFALDIEIPRVLQYTEVNSTSTQGEHELSADLGQLYNSGLLSDVALVAGTRRFPLHRAILASRSTFFETMFAGPYAEAFTSEINLEGNAEAIDFVLRFLYTNRVDTDAILADPDLVSSVLGFVDFWDVAKLLEILESALGQELEKGNMDPLELISFAKSHNCGRLALRCLQYCKQHFTSLHLRDAEPELVTEITDYVNSLL